MEKNYLNETISQLEYIKGELHSTRKKLEISKKIDKGMSTIKKCCTSINTCAKIVIRVPGAGLGGKIA